MLFELIILFLSIPSGLFIALLARDELIDGRKYFKALFIFSLILTVFIGNEIILLTSGFIAISAWISLLKSYDSSWAIIRKI